MLEACAPHARWIDVFCDHGAFDAEETRAVLRAGVAAGLQPRLHGNQLGFGPGAQIAAEFGAASLDHCTHLGHDDAEAIREAGVVATLLPAAEFSTRSPYADARRLLEVGVTVALATDCNPGSAYVTSMPFVIALAVRDMRMTPAEALWSATAGGAAALRRDDIGRLAPGCSADLALLDAPSHVHLAYRPASPLVASTWIAGERLHDSGVRP
jgi:imidazolonepropionase